MAATDSESLIWKERAGKYRRRYRGGKEGRRTALWYCSSLLMVVMGMVSCSDERGRSQWDAEGSQMSVRGVEAASLVRRRKKRVGGRRRRQVNRRRHPSDGGVARRAQRASLTLPTLSLSPSLALISKSSPPPDHVVRPRFLPSPSTERWINSTGLGLRRSFPPLRLSTPPLSERREKEKGRDGRKWGRNERRRERTRWREV
jgi:hypothetical protein